MANEPMENGVSMNDGLNERCSTEKALKFAKKLYIHGGNISNWNRIKRKTTPSSSDEVCFEFYVRCLIFEHTRDMYKLRALHDFQFRLHQIKK